MRSYAGRSLLREILASIRTQPTFTLVTLLLVGASTLTVIMTAGRAAASEAAVLATIDAQGTRTIVIQAKGSQSGIDEQLVATLARLSDVEAVTGFGAVTDVTAAANPAGSRIGLRTGYGTIDGIPLTQPSPGRIGPVVWASWHSTQVVGLPDGAGSLRAIDGPEYLIARTLTVPDYLAELEPLSVVPAVPRKSNQPPRPISTIYVLARTPQSVAQVSTVLEGLLTDVPRDDVAISTSASLVSLRDAIGGEITRSSRGLILGVLGASALTSALTVLGYTMMRRKDFGRRRALGATRLTIVLLIALQVLITAAMATSLGAFIAHIWLSGRGHPTPPIRFTVAVAVAIAALTTLGAVLPATIAARRDPVRELRVP